MTNKITLNELHQSLKDKINPKKTETWIATEGQTLFTMVGTYEMNKDILRVYVGNVPQFIGDNYTEVSTNSFQLTSGVPAGVEVRVRY